MSKRLVAKLITALKEKDVENAYREELLAFIKEASITSPYGSDGLLDALEGRFKNLKMLLEFKYRGELKGNVHHCGILVQCLYYIKRFEQDGKKLPNIIFVGDENECFALHTNSIIKYLDSPIDWTIAASEAAIKNPELVMAMVGDQDVTPFVFSVRVGADFHEVIDKIDDLNKNVVRLVRVTAHNINTIFDYFCENVLDAKHNGLSAVQLANLFVQILINTQDNYMHPTKKGVLVTKNMGDVRVHAKLFESFFSHFDPNYSPKEKEGLTAMVDRLVEDMTRRREGAFYTPTIWADEAHKELTKNLGADWKEKYVVYDPCCGTGQLVRDYQFKELYCSTLNQEDIDTMEQMGYNPEAHKFQYDFLNESESEMADKAPRLLEALMLGRPLLVLMNPPYATSSIAGAGNSDHKAGTSITATGQSMKEQGWLGESQQLYTQFLYKVFTLRERYGLKDVQIGVFSKPAFLVGESFCAFRKKFFAQFNMKSCFMFQASEFSDVSGLWGISFSHISGDGPDVRTEWPVDLRKVDEETFSIIKFGEKPLYNCDAVVPASEWAKIEANLNKNKGMTIPHMSSALAIKDVKFIIPSNGHIGSSVSLCNNVYKNSQCVYVVSGIGTAGNAGGFSIIPSNFHKVTTLFAARKAITGAYANWINDKDEYLAPNEQHPLWQQFVDDSIVYSLFNNSSQQSALRGVTYKDKLWDIKNEFAFMSKGRMMELADQHGFDAMYQDARTADERFVYTKLFGPERVYDRLSSDAKTVLDQAIALTEKSFLARMMMHAEHPEYHLQAWDAGYAQMKLVWGKAFKDEFKAFREAYGRFNDRMVPLVYELGFLKGQPIRLESVKEKKARTKKVKEVAEVV